VAKGNERCLLNIISVPFKPRSHSMSSIKYHLAPLKCRTAHNEHNICIASCYSIFLLPLGSTIMAALSNSLIFLCFLLLPGVLAFAGPHGESYPCPYDCPPQKETHLHMYLHQFPAWANVTNPNEVAWQGWVADHWLLTKGPDPNNNIVGRARGFHLLTGETSKDWYISHIYVFQDNR
jgi:hypothetical protein